MGSESNYLYPIEIIGHLGIDFFALQFKGALCLNSVRLMIVLFFFTVQLPCGCVTILFVVIMHIFLLHLR